jgi:hypothetical protein
VDKRTWDRINMINKRDKSLIKKVILSLSDKYENIRIESIGDGYREDIMIVNFRYKVIDEYNKVNYGPNVFCPFDIFGWTKATTTMQITTSDIRNYLIENIIN